MKKAIWSALSITVLAAAGYGLYLYLLSPQTVVCTRLAQLCDITKATAIEDCEAVLKEVGESDTGAIREAASCVVNANSCGEGAGCVIGAGANVSLKGLAPFLKSAPAIVNDFIEGMKRGSGELFE